MPYRWRLGIHHSKLIGAIEMMEANVEEPLDQTMLARYVGLSRRQLERCSANTWPQPGAVLPGAAPGARPPL